MVTEALVVGLTLTPWPWATYTPRPRFLWLSVTGQHREDGSFLSPEKALLKHLPCLRDIVKMAQGFKVTGTSGHSAILLPKVSHHQESPVGWGHGCIIMMKTEKKTSTFERVPSWLKGKQIKSELCQSSILVTRVLETHKQLSWVWICVTTASDGWRSLSQHTDLSMENSPVFPPGSWRANIYKDFPLFSLPFGGGSVYRASMKLISKYSKGCILFGKNILTYV